MLCVLTALIICGIKLDMVRAAADIPTTVSISMYASTMTIWHKSKSAPADYGVVLCLHGLIGALISSVEATISMNKSCS